MDMTVNLTILVQIGNFFVAYVMLSYLFFRPGYHAVRLDEDHQRTLKSNITARQELIAHKQEYKNSRWKLFQDYFTRQKPDLKEETKIAHALAPAKVACLTDQESASLTQEVVAKLKEIL